MKQSKSAETVSYYLNKKNEDYEGLPVILVEEEKYNAARIGALLRTLRELLVERENLQSLCMQQRITIRELNAEHLELMELWEQREKEMDAPPKPARVVSEERKAAMWRIWLSKFF